MATRRQPKRRTAANEHLIRNPAGELLANAAHVATIAMAAHTFRKNPELRENPSSGFVKIFEIEMNGYRQELGRYVGHLQGTSVLDALVKAEKYVKQWHVVIVTDTELVGDAKHVWISIDGHPFEDFSGKEFDLNEEISRVQGPHRVAGGKTWLLEQPEKAYGARASWWGDAFEHADELLESGTRMREHKKSWWEKKTDGDDDRGDDVKENPAVDYDALDDAAVDRILDIIAALTRGPPGTDDFNRQVVTSFFNLVRQAIADAPTEALKERVEASYMHGSFRLTWNAEGCGAAGFGRSGYGRSDDRPGVLYGPTTRAGNNAEQDALENSQNWVREKSAMQPGYTHRFVYVPTAPAAPDWHGDVLLPEDLVGNPADDGDREPPFLSLARVEENVPLAAELGVSEVARSARGFLAAYRRAGGRASELPEKWRRKRAAFVARHMAQARDHNEDWLRTGELSRRHLALIMWAYSPTRARKNPADAREGLRQISEGSASAASFEEFYPQPASETFGEADWCGQGQSSVWVGPPGKCVLVDPHYCVPIAGNIFDPDKLDAVAGAVRAGVTREEDGGVGEDDEGRPVFFVGYGTVSLIDERDVQESKEAWEHGDSEWSDGPLTDDDVGNLLFTIRDGNHRVFGAFLGGEERVWMQLYAQQFQDVQDWRKARDAGRADEYQEKHGDHWTRLMQMLSAMLDESEIEEG